MIAANAARVAGELRAKAGVGLRPQHIPAILEQRPPVAWFEALTDNYLVDGGPLPAKLLAVREHYAVALHGVGLSLGSLDPLDQDYLRRLRALAGQTEPLFISDHLCWNAHDGIHHCELLPVPYTAEALDHIAARIRQVQDFLGRRIAIENPSSYVSFLASEMEEWTFLSELAELADCMLLLDVNNVYVSCFNHGWNPERYIRGIAADRVQQYHLAGHDDCGTHLLDSHGAAVHDAVWELFAGTVARIGCRPTLLEWDQNLPALPILLAEAEKAQALLTPTSRATE
jgi:uncharacterized protein